MNQTKAKHKQTCEKH